MREKIIDITELFSKDLKSRSVARELRDMIINEKSTRVKINFDSVNFITRSFMDEFYNVIVTNKNFDIELINFSPEMEAMLDAVKSTQHKSKKTSEKKVSGADLKFSTISEANKYLEALSF